MTSRLISATIHDQISGLPSAKELSAKLEEYKTALYEAKDLNFPAGIAFKAGMGIVIGGSKAYPKNGTLVDGVPFLRNKLTMDMLQALGKLRDETVPKEILDGLAGLDKDFSKYLNDPNVQKWVTQGSEMMSVSMAQAGTVSDLTMEALKIGSATYEMATSGRYITDKETMGFAVSTGAGVGGMIGSIFPGIGTAIGTAVGAAIGALVGGITAAFSHPNFDKILAEQAKIAQDAASALTRHCRENLQEEISAKVLETISQLSTTWINAERSLGYRFDLRWFGSNPGIRFESTSQGGDYLSKLLGNRLPTNLTPKQIIDGYDYPYGLFKCFVEQNQRKTAFPIYYRLNGKQQNATFTAYGQETNGACNFYCPEPILGCLYPRSARSDFSNYGLPRIADAFAARGVTLPIDLGCNQIIPVMHNPRQADVDVVNCTNIDGWGGSGSKGEKAGDICAARVAAATAQQAENLKRNADILWNDFTVAAKLVSGDLTKTISLMQSQQSILMNRINLEGEGVFSDIATLYVANRNEHVRRMRNISLAGGAALAGLALWKVMR